jgi:cytochrome c oxidase subunit 3
MARVATTTVDTTAPHGAVNRPNMVSVGTIVWLSSELMFFAALFAMYFTIRSVTGESNWPPERFNLPEALSFSGFNTLVLILSSLTCQIGVFAAERGDVKTLRRWFVITFLMGAFFVGGQIFEYSTLIKEGSTISSSAYGSVFYLTTGFHGMHVTGGLIAFLLVLGRTYAAGRFTHEQATTAIVVSYYWHFVDVVWIGLFMTIFMIR